MTNTTLPTDVRVDPLVLESAQRAWTFKEDGCSKTEHFDIVPIVAFCKDGKIVAELLPGHISRDNALAIIDICIGPFDADLVVLNVDAHVTQAMTNPVTGKPWGPGEMQGLCDTEGACSTGLLTDCISSMAVFRDGHHEMVQRKYTGHEGVGTLTWQEPDHFLPGNGGTPGGYVTDRMEWAMQQVREQEHSDLRERLRESADAEDIPVPDRYWHEVMAGCHLALLSGAACGAMAYPPPEHEHIVAESLTQERLDSLRNSPLGVLAPLLGVKFGIE